jgi:hypothetical protein
MKLKTLFVTVLIMAGYMSGQTSQYPLVTLHDINFIPDSTTGWPPSPKAGDTVRVQGTVMVKPIVNPIGDRRVILNQPPGWTCNIQAQDRSPWTGLIIYQNDTNAIGTFFDLCDTNRTYEFTGVVKPKGQSTELDLITSPSSIPVKLISHEIKRPKPISLTWDSLFNANGSINVEVRKYLGMYVEFVVESSKFLITSDLIKDTSINSGGFNINDTSGHFFRVVAKSGYIKTAKAYTLRPSWTPPPNGSRLDHIAGLLNISGNVWEVIPMYPEDARPRIYPYVFFSGCSRSYSIVPFNTPVIVKTVAYGMNTEVISVQLFSRVNGIDNPVTNMMKGSGADSSTYTGTIPAITTGDSSYVEYYCQATDYNNQTYTNPWNINVNRYSYFVFSNAHKKLTIQHVRYSPLGSGYSSYNGYPVTVTGVVTADTSDIPGSNANNVARVYIQNGTGPWSGIILGYKGPVGMNVYNLKRGDLVSVTGSPALSTAYGTRLDTLTDLTVISHNNPLPAAHHLLTSEVGTAPLGDLNAEPWNGCIVTYNDVTIDSANADGPIVNYGESYAQDAALGTHTRVTWSDGRTKFFAGPTAVLVHNGDKFWSLSGILGYTHSNYKLCPRNDSDIDYGIHDGIGSENSIIPTENKLGQNYPNPFNPSTKIKYSVKTNSLVTLKVYDILGKEIAVLLNENKLAGEYEVEFSARQYNLTSGIYFYRLTAGSFTSVRKMILLK